jgi:prolyl-tRNA synthetase
LIVLTSPLGFTVFNRQSQIFNRQLSWSGAGEQEFAILAFGRELDDESAILDERIKSLLIVFDRAAHQNFLTCL